MPRAALAILNELSLPDPTGPSEGHEVEAAMDTFVQALIAARKVRKDLALVSHQNLLAIVLDESGLTLAAFLQQRSGRCRELLRMIRAMRNHAPFATAPSLSLPDDGEEFFHNGRHIDGLGFAAANHKLAVSMRAAEWSSSTVRVQRHWLDEAGGEVTTKTEDIDVTHAATAAHVEGNEKFLREMTLPDPLTGAPLWSQRAHLFPRITFLPRVEEQLRRHLQSPGEPASVLEQLTKLDRATATWDRATEPFPNWGLWVTPEGEQRKRLCRFRDVDGTKRCFDLHTRFNPSPGRIHFRLAHDGSARLVVAHVGPKLGT